MLLEEVLEFLIEKNVYYKTPKDKEQQLYDFYMLTILKDLPYSPDIAKDKRFSNLDLSTSASIDEAAETIVNDLVPSMKSAIEFAVAAEFRHIFVNNGASKIKKFFAKYNEKGFIKKYAQSYKLKQISDGEWAERDRENLVNRFKDNSRGYQDSYEALKLTKIPTSKFMRMAADAFRNLNWSRSYGGEPWAQIAEGWTKLDNAKTYNDKVIAIDHAYDLQHNTDTVFNKLKSYYKGGYSWIRKALDFKKHIKNVWELYPKVSSDVKTLTGYIAKDKGWGTLDQFLETAKKSKGTKNMKFDKPKELDIEKHYTVDNSKVWKKGSWTGGTWKGGTWEGGLWKIGTWETGTWKTGTWVGGIWKSGTWESGTWNNGTWVDGEWQNGTWNKGIWYDGVWKNGEWKNGTWKDGTWENGTWKMGRWKDGIWESGTWKGGVWEDGFWEYGLWKSGTWKGGIWKEGVWEEGDWMGGTWERGDWETGWIHDPFKEGNYEDDWKWMQNSVQSTLNPKEYFKK